MGEGAGGAEEAGSDGLLPGPSCRVGGGEDANVSEWLPTSTFPHPFRFVVLSCRHVYVAFAHVSLGHFACLVSRLSGEIFSSDFCKFSCDEGEH
jgi:hypothetical protein